MTVEIVLIWQKLKMAKLTYDIMWDLKLERTTKYEAFKDFCVGDLVEIM